MEQSVATLLNLMGLLTFKSYDVFLVLEHFDVLMLDRWHMCRFILLESFALISSLHDKLSVLYLVESDRLRHFLWLKRIGIQDGLKWMRRRILILAHWVPCVFKGILTDVDRSALPRVINVRVGLVLLAHDLGTVVSAVARYLSFHLLLRLRFLLTMWHVRVKIRLQHLRLVNLVVSFPL